MYVVALQWNAWNAHARQHCMVHTCSTWLDGCLSTRRSRWLVGRDWSTGCLIGLEDEMDEEDDDLKALTEGVDHSIHRLTGRLRG